MGIDDLSIADEHRELWAQSCRKHVYVDNNGGLEENCFRFLILWLPCM